MNSYTPSGLYVTPRLDELMSINAGRIIPVSIGNIPIRFEEPGENQRLVLGIGNSGVSPAVCIAAKIDQIFQANILPFEPEIKVPIASFRLPNVSSDFYYEDEVVKHLRWYSAVLAAFISGQNIVIDNFSVGKIDVFSAINGLLMRSDYYDINKILQVLNSSGYDIDIDDIRYLCSVYDRQKPPQVEITSYYKTEGKQCNGHIFLRNAQG